MLKVRKNPTYTIHGVNEIARTLWVANVMANPGKDVMAVQTLRNFVMGASLMASTATFLIVGTLTLSGQAESIGRSWHSLNLFAIGMRAFSFAVPLVFWLFGPPFLVIATIGLLIALYHLDRSEPPVPTTET